MAKKLMAALLTSMAVMKTAGADGFNWHLQSGVAWANFTGNTQDIVMNANTTNRYSVSTPSQTDAILAAGVAYQWDFSHTAFDLGFSAYYMGSSVAGSNAPLVNGGDFDTLNYKATGRSLAFMLEPKWIWTTHEWQPYVLAGLGVAFNHFGDYSETPTDPSGSAVPASQVFTGATTTGLAYEGGVGVQHRLTTMQDSPLIAIDYRFMDWGKANLGSVKFFL